MGEIKDFQCTYDNSAGINEEVTRELDLNVSGRIYAT